MIRHSIKMHVKFFVSYINKGYIQNFKTIAKLMFIYFEMLSPNVSIIQFIKKTKKNS